MLFTLPAKITVLFLLTLAAALQTTFTNNNIFQFDTDGNNIDSTSGKVVFLDEQYIWYGLNFGCGELFCGISSWSSPDLTTWKSNGLLFDPATSQIEELCALSGNCGRPHVIYNDATEKYVLWVNAGFPGYVTFISSSATGGFVLNKNRAAIGYQPPVTQGGDFAVSVIDGTGYLAYSSIDFSTLGASIWPPFLQSIYVQELTPDFLSTTGSAYHVAPVGDFVDFEAESPDIWKRGDYFYVTASNTCGFCTGTLLIVYRSKSFMGPWTRQIISEETCGGQSMGVLTLPSPSGRETTYLQESDVISSAPNTGIRTAAHGHRFQTLSFNPDGSLQELDCSPYRSTTIDIVPGINVSTDGLTVSATDSSSLVAPYFQVCDIPANSLYQTWASSKSGVLTEVGVNIAGDAPTSNVTFTVFRYQNNTNFFTPRYTWETLTSLSLTPASISQALDVVRIPINKQVYAGDRLGVAIVSLGITPICRLGTKCTDCLWDEESSTRTLFYSGVNQVSYRGIDGKSPPVKVLYGQEIKWYAIVE